MELCDPYFWENPKYIVQSLYPSNSPCASHMVNRVFFVYILALLLSFVLDAVTKSKSVYISAGVIATILLLPTFLTLQELQAKREGFAEQTVRSDDRKIPVVVQGREDIPLSSESARNPFQNVTLDQYSYAPTRDPAPSLQTQEAKESMDALFRVQWTSDPTDVFGKTQSQRMFITQPNTSIPNDQGSYQNWLYKIPGKTCKEGNYEACYGGTNGGALPWLNL